MKDKELEAYIREAKEKEYLRRHMLECVKYIVEAGRLPKIVDLMIEASPAFKSEESRNRIKAALNVLRVTSSPKELQEALFASKEYRKAKFGCEWELPVRVAQGIVLDLLEGRSVLYPRAEDIRNSRLFFETVLTYIPEGMTMDEFEKTKHSWVEELIANHFELA